MKYYLKIRKHFYSNNARILKFATFTFLLLSAFLLNAQIYCGSVGGGAGGVGAIPSPYAERPAPEGPFTFRVYIHTVRHLDGSGGVSASSV